MTLWISDLASTVASIAVNDLPFNDDFPDSVALDTVDFRTFRHFYLFGYKDSLGPVDVAALIAARDYATCRAGTARSDHRPKRKRNGHGTLSFVGLAPMKTARPLVG
jgi:hypothetical protein